MVLIRFFPVLLLLLIGACSSPPPVESDAPVILISVDTLRSDRLPAYGYSAIQTPAIDGLRQDGILFEKAYSHSPLTLPSHVSMMTGLLPRNHGVRGNLGYALSDHSIQTLAHRYKEAGFDTGAVISSMVLRKSVGLDRGFDFYDDNMPQISSENAMFGNYAQRDGQSSLDVALDWLENRNKPFFLWLHLYDPHTPYEPPAGYGSGYDGEIVWTDHLLDQLFDFLKKKGIYQNAVILLVSDHGEGLGDHGEKEHGLFLYREALQVPFILKLPNGRDAGKTLSQPVGLSDVAPTLAALSGLEPLAADGLHVLDKLPRKRDIPAESFFAQTHYGWHPQKSAINGNLHYMEGFEPELYDLDTDFNEKNNLFGKRAVPKTMLAITQSSEQGDTSRAEVSDQDRAMLESLGYTGSFSGGDEILSLSPRALVDLINDLDHCRSLMNRNAFDEAMPQLKAIVTNYPMITHARLLLAGIMSEQGDTQKADHLLTEGLALSPKDSNLLTELARLRLLDGKLEDAGQLARKALEQDSWQASESLLNPFYEAGQYQLAEQMAEVLVAGTQNKSFPWFVSGRLALLRGDFQLARNRLIEAEKRMETGHFVEARVSNLVFLAEAQLALEDGAGALESLETALELAPDMAQTHVLLARTQAATGTWKEAQNTIAEALKEKPGDPILLSGFASLYMERNKLEQALELAEKALKADAAVSAPQLARTFPAGGNPQAMQALAAVLQKHAPGQAETHLFAGNMAHRSRDWSAALQHFGRALIIQEKETRTDVREINKTLLMMGDCAANMRNVEDARTWFGRAYQVLPSDGSAPMALTMLYAGVGDRRGAQQIMDGWLRNYPSPANFRAAAQTMERLGMTQKAKEYQARAGQ